jgi:hypothetical protein
MPDRRQVLAHFWRWVFWCNILNSNPPSPLALPPTGGYAKAMKGDKNRRFLWVMVFFLAISFWHFYLVFFNIYFCRPASPPSGFAAVRRPPCLQQAGFAKGDTGGLTS